MTIQARPATVAVDSSTIISVAGPPNRAVYWALGNSSGTLVALQQRTDDQGRAAAIFTPDITDLGLDALITASYGS
jgi:hypothetical protein